MGFLADCEELFGTSDLYKLLGVPKDASEAAIKKAYRRLSLLVHPDREGDAQKETATRKCQVLSKVHLVLGDSDKRAAYDNIGCVDEDDDLAGDRDWTSYWAVVFPKINLDDLDKYLAKYRGSSQEVTDLKEHYERFEGDFNAISECLVGFEIEDEDRYRNILNKLIEDGEVKAYPKFTKETKKSRNVRKRWYIKEAKEAKKREMEEGLDGSGESLPNAIAKRQRSNLDIFGGFRGVIANLEATYCKPKKKKASK
ncbi:dnaJ homolog subfamily C member 9-like [Dermacentor andersoni]|uniref:dnaJ homolog subfamily C member 9-like n=1 Tax=Dermacentor andersoni TaxID=34620 RepID=UPI002417ADDA|nr:dnaJ homolog subfamily C member 9-like [Dermacentor andersoni]